jgi:branched-chain amino acid transport system substrate-binding protein
MVASGAVLALASGLTLAAGDETPGVTKTSIKIGQTMPYSGPASAYGAIGKADVAYFAMINEQGGINGRKVELISRDDGYNPAKTVEQIRKLVEDDQVAFIFNSLGTPSNTAIQGYLTDNKIPQLFVATGASKWNDPAEHPWTMGWQPNYRVEARIYAKYILENMPTAKIAILYQNDDFGKDYIIGLREGLGAKADAMIVAVKSYETTDPTVDSQVAALKESGATVFVNAATPKFAAQAIRKIGDLGWKVDHFITNVSVSVGSVLKPAGLDKSTGLITAAYVKDPTDAQWQESKEFKDWLAWVKKYDADANVADNNVVYGYSVTETLVHVLKDCGNDLSRTNIMKQAASLKNLKLPMLLPGVEISTGADDFAPIKAMQLAKFDGTTWKLFGKVISGGAGS